MSEIVVLTDIAFRVDPDDINRRLRIADRPKDVKAVAELIGQAERIARPKAVFRVAYIEAKESHAVVVDGTRFESRILRVNLDEVHRAFPFVTTCGRELHEWARSIDDMLARYWADELAAWAGRQAFDAMKTHIMERHRIGHASIMSPGSLQDWPIEQQRPLFDLIGDVRDRIGVELTDSMLMVPVKSLSGILFALEVDFESCQLCPRDPCPGRRAPYDADLYPRKYAGNKGDKSNIDGGRRLDS